MPGNPHLQSYENKLILGKSSPEKDTYDTLAFVFKSIETVLIPSSIESIPPNAFQFCSKLKKVEFPSDSKLRIICNLAFSQSTIESISFPASLTTIELFAFQFC